MAKLEHEQREKLIAERLALGNGALTREQAALAVDHQVEADEATAKRQKARKTETKPATN